MPKQGMNQRRILTGIFFFLVVFYSPAGPRNQFTDFPHQRFSNEALDSLLADGEAEYQKGLYEEALKTFKICLDFARTGEDARSEVNCLNKLGLVYWNIGRMEDYHSCLTQGVSLARQLKWERRVEDGEDFLEIFRSYTEGKELRAESRYEESLRSFARAIELSREKRSPEHELKCCRQLSLTYWALFRLPEFYATTLRALDIARTLHHRREEAKGLINIGLYYQKIEDYSKALVHYRQALEIARKIGDKSDESASLNNIGILYRRIGDFDRSLDHLKQALALDIELENEIFISQDMNNIGTTFRLNSLTTGKGELMEEALSFYLESLKMARNARDVRTEIEVLNNIGVVHSFAEDFDRALQCFHAALQLTDGFPYMEARCMLLNNIAGLYLKMGVFREAEKIYKEAIEMGLLIERGYILWEAFYGLGQSYEKEDEAALALDCYAQALTYVDQIRSSISLDAFKAGFARDKIKIYESFINLLYSSGQGSASLPLSSEIFHIIERAKARAFLESLGESRVDVFRQLGPELEQREREITSLISQCVHGLSEPGLSENQRQKLRNRMRQAEEEYLMLLARIRTENPGLFSLLEPEPSQLESVQSDLLDDRTAIVEYFLGEETSFGLVINNIRAEIFPLPCREVVVNMLRAYLKILSEPPTGSFRGGPAARRLYDVFFAPADDLLPSAIENLIIIPDGILYYLPFETLVSPGERESNAGKYLIQRFAMAYAPSCSSLFALMKREKEDSKPLSFLAFGSPSLDTSPAGNHDPLLPCGVTEELYINQGFKMVPLPHSCKEARKIARLFDRDHRRVLLRSEASEEAIKNLPLQDYTIIHFACHGFLDEQSPFRSALVLSQDKNSQEDGFLQVREIYNLRVAAEMVVLSACQTAKGPMESVEGILGLPRIFFYTGARTVLTSLWRIQDNTTARFMTRFYQNLVSGHPKAHALRLAKLEMIQSRLSHPYFWAAYVLNGDFSTTVVSNK
jgi:CHAT domain-containing protein/Tfp pilus assembly protein PilF